MKYSKRISTWKNPVDTAVTKAAVKKATETVKKAAVTNIVQKELSKNEEVKMVANIAVANKVLVYGSGLNFGGASPNQGWVSTGGLIPALSQGFTSATRVGNKVNPKSLKVRYSIYANPTTEVGSTALPGGNINPFYGLPFRVKVIVFRHRFAIDEPSQVGIINDGATNSDLSSDIDTFFRPYNRDEYIIGYSKMFKLQNPRHNLTGTAFTGQTQEPYTKSMVIRQIKLKLPQLRYNDAATTAANSQWFIAFAVCNEDSSVITAGSQSRITVNVESYLSFTDA